ACRRPGRLGRPRRAGMPQRALFPRAPASRRGGYRLREDGSRLPVDDDLPLHALERVVDRLRVTPEELGHLLVRVALEVEAECIRFELRQPATSRQDSALE